MRLRQAVSAVMGASGAAAPVEKDEGPELIRILRGAERNAAGLIKANQQLADHGSGDARFTAVAGGEEYLAKWRQWVEKNLGIRL